MPASLDGGWRGGNFLYPYARALMLANSKGPNGDGIGWGNGDNKYRIMFLNAGVGTAYEWTSIAQSALSGSGFAVTGYAWNPVAYDAGNEAIHQEATPAITVNDQFRGSLGDNNDLGVGKFAGSIVTSLGQIPVSHRTFQVTMSGTQVFGGTANTAVVTGCAITYNGVADANDVTIYQVPSGAFVSAFVLYRLPNNITSNSSGIAVPSGGGWASGSFGGTIEIDRNSVLLAYFDSATGLPVNGNGGDITVVWDNGGNRIFKI